GCLELGIHMAQICAGFCSIPQPKGKSKYHVTKNKNRKLNPIHLYLLVFLYFTFLYRHSQYVDFFLLFLSSKNFTIRKKRRFPMSAVGFNPLAYEGVKAPNPPNMIRARRAPNAQDINHDLGIFWLDELTQTMYV